MGRKKINPSIIALIAILAIAAGTAVYFGYQYYNTQSTQTVASTTTTTTTSFSLKVVDGISYGVLPKDSFDYDFYGLTKGGSASDFLDWELIESGTTLDSITAGDFDAAEYSMYAALYNGTVDEEEFDDGLGDRTYGARWSYISPGVANTLLSYWTPSTAFFNVFNAETGAYVDLSSANITTATNVTIMVATNASQVGACYMYGWNLQNMEYDRPRLVINFNTTVASTDFAIAGTTKTRVNSTAYSYAWNSISHVPTVLQGRWDDDAADIEIVGTDCLLYHGDSEI